MSYTIKPRAWLCELMQEDGTTRTQFVEQDPDGLNFNDVGKPSPFRVTPLYDLTDATRLISAEADFKAMTWTFEFPPGTRIGAGQYALVWTGPAQRLAANVPMSRAHDTTADACPADAPRLDGRVKPLNGGRDEVEL